MRNSLIAIIAAAAVAAVAAFITEPVANGKIGMPQTGVSGVSQPAVKGDRLDLRPVEGCALLRERGDYRGSCLPKRAVPARQPSEIRIVSVRGSPVELSTLSAAT